MASLFKLMCHRGISKTHTRVIRKKSDDLVLGLTVRGHHLFFYEIAENFFDNDQLMIAKKGGCWLATVVVQSKWGENQHFAF